MPELKMTKVDLNLARLVHEASVGNIELGEYYRRAGAESPGDSRGSLDFFLQAYQRLLKGKPPSRNLRDSLFVTMLVTILERCDEETLHSAVRAMAVFLAVQKKKGRKRPGLHAQLQEFVRVYKLPVELLDAIAEVKPKKEDDSQAWLFQANPEHYDIISAVREQEMITWGVQKSHIKRIKPGDRAYVWMCGPEAGIIASGHIETNPHQLPENRQDAYILDGRSFKHQMGVDIRLDSVMLDSALAKEMLLETPSTSLLSILHVPRGTNFAVKPDEAHAIDEMLARAGFIDVPPVPAEILKNYEPVKPRTAAQPKYEKYMEENFLQEVFMPAEALPRLLALWKRRKNLVLEGPPGVGKSFVARRLAWLLLEEKDESRLMEVQFHQSYSYDDFVQGWRPKGAGFSLEKGVVFDFCVDAGKDKGRPYVLLIDEINRGNLSNILGELLSLIEPTHRGREIQLRSGDRLAVPENLYIIGTMNTADRSIADFNYAHRRRFAFYPLAPAFGQPGFAAHLQAGGLPEQAAGEIVSRMQQLNTDIRRDMGDDYCVGHSFFCGPGSAASWYRDVIEFEILPLLKEYYAGMPDKLQDFADTLLEPLYAE